MFILCLFTGCSQGGVVGQRRGGGSSVASSFWRPARVDRTDAMSIIDERFERLALEYEDEEIGELEEDDEATRPPACMQNDEYVQEALDEYIRTHRKGNEVVRCHPLNKIWKLSEILLGYFHPNQFFRDRKSVV